MSGEQHGNQSSQKTSKKKKWVSANHLLADQNPLQTPKLRNAEVLVLKKENKVLFLGDERYTDGYLQGKKKLILEMTLEQYLRLQAEPLKKSRAALDANPTTKQEREETEMPLVPKADGQPAVGSEDKKAVPDEVADVDADDPEGSVTELAVPILPESLLSADDALVSPVSPLSVVDAVEEEEDLDKTVVALNASGLESEMDRTLVPSMFSEQQLSEVSSSVDETISDEAALTEAATLLSVTAIKDDQRELEQEERELDEEEKALEQEERLLKIERVAAQLVADALQEAQKQLKQTEVGADPVAEPVVTHVEELLDDQATLTDLQAIIDKDDGFNVQKLSDSEVIAALQAIIDEADGLLPSDVPVVTITEEAPIVEVDPQEIERQDALRAKEEQDARLKAEQETAARLAAATLISEQIATRLIASGVKAATEAKPAHTTEQPAKSPNWFVRLGRWIASLWSRFTTWLSSLREPAVSATIPGIPFGDGDDARFDASDVIVDRITPLTSVFDGSPANAAKTPVVDKTLTVDGPKVKPALE